jgi:hypothetical protein
MLPSDQGLGTHDLAAGEIDDRLVEQAHLAALDRPPQVSLELEALDRLRAHRRLEQRMDPGRLGLGPVEGDLGVAERIERARRPRTHDDDAHPGRHEHLDRRARTAPNPHPPRGHGQASPGPAPSRSRATRRPNRATVSVGRNASRRRARPRPAVVAASVANHR